MYLFDEMYPIHGHQIACRVQALIVDTGTI